MFNRTLGGRQWWGDVRHFQRWRIQRNVITGHFRLLDPRDRRHAWGSRENCDRKLTELIESQAIPPMSGDGVVLLHGLGCSSKHFTRMAQSLEDAGFCCFPFDYPSTRVSISESAAYLRSVVESLDGIQRIHLVAHSMGGLVSRRYLADTADEPDHRLGRLVMIGTPNRGAQLSDRLRPFFGFRWLFGPPAFELSTAEEGYIAHLPPPRIPFGIIAGTVRNGRGWNPLITGDDDFIVSVESTKLEGAADFLLISGLHRFLPCHPQVISATQSFLQHGTFER